MADTRLRELAAGTWGTTAWRKSLASWTIREFTWYDAWKSLHAASFRVQQRSTLVPRCSETRLQAQAIRG